MVRDTNGLLAVTRIIVEMGRYTGPKRKKEKRFEEKKRISLYGKLLLEKQKVKFRYGLRERQFKNLYEEAIKRRSEPTGTVLLQMLELRLDNVVFRLGLAKTRPQARQFVTRGLIMVDGEIVNIPSYRVKPGQVITMTEKAFESEFIKNVLSQAIELPEWLEVQNRLARVIRPPAREEIDQDLNENAIIAYYSR